MADIYAVFGQQIFNIAKARRIANVEHHRHADHFGRGVETAKRTGRFGSGFAAHPVNYQ